MAARQSSRSIAFGIGATAVGAALSPRLLPKLPTRRRIVRRLVLGTFLTWGAKELMQPERQARFAAEHAADLREHDAERVEELRRRLGRDPLDEEVVAFVHWGRG